MARVCDKCRFEFETKSDIVLVDINKSQETYDLCEKCSDKLIKFIKVPIKKGWF